MPGRPRVRMAWTISAHAAGIRKALLPRITSTNESSINRAVGRHMCSQFPFSPAAAASTTTIVVLFQALVPSHSGELVGILQAKTATLSMMAAFFWVPTVINALFAADRTAKSQSASCRPASRLTIWKENGQRGQHVTCCWTSYPPCAVCWPSHCCLISCQTS